MAGTDRNLIPMKMSAPADEWVLLRMGTWRSQILRCTESNRETLQLNSIAYYDLLCYWSPPLARPRIPGNFQPMNTTKFQVCPSVLKVASEKELNTSIPRKQNVVDWLKFATQLSIALLDSVL